MDLPNFSNEQDKKIVEKTLSLKNLKYETHKYFTDGASSRVILLNSEYLIKQNSAVALEAEVEFLKRISTIPEISNYFQKIVYVEPEYNFVVYSFINGNVMKNPENPKKVVSSLLDITSSLPTYEKEGFGYLGEETKTWIDFLKEEIKYSSENVPENICENSFVYKAAEDLEKFKFTKKLLHGDFGTHNFIEINGNFVGVIDPMPVAGDSLYDLLFGICSNVKLLSSFSLEELLNITNDPKEKIKNLLIVVLYSRISRCLKYHPKDLNIYLDYINKLYNKSIDL